MAVCPFAVKRLIPPGSNDPRITPHTAVLHVDAGNSASLYDYFANRSGGIESHFHIRTDGTIEQYRDTNYQADANYEANDYAVSIETQGYEMGWWSDAQIEAIKRLLAWLNQAHDIPLRRCPSAGQPGIGYHVLFGAPGPWTPVAKSCPGPNRIRQFETVLLPWMSSARSTPTPSTATGDEDDMSYDKWSPEGKDAYWRDYHRERNRPSGALWRFQELTYWIVRKLGGRPYQIIEAARAARKQRKQG